MSKNTNAVYKTATYKQTTTPPMMNSCDLTRLTYKRSTPIIIYSPTLPPPNCGKEPISFSERENRRKKLILLNIWYQLAAPYVMALVNYKNIYQSVYEQWSGMIFDVHTFVQDITQLIDWKGMKDKVNNVMDIKTAIISSLYQLYNIGKKK
eukprot:367369_1